MPPGVRTCARCGTRLARDNVDALCSPCARAVRQQDEPPRLADEWWYAEPMRSALASKDMGLVVRAYRTHPDHGRTRITQADLARWLGISQGQLSRIESGRNRVRDLDNLVHYARRLRIPAEVLWFAVDEEPAARLPAALLRLPGGVPVPAATVRTEPALADSLLTTLDQYVSTDNLAGPLAVLPVAEQQSRLTDRMLAASRGAGRERMLYVSARFAEFTGWLHQDAGDLRSAMYWSNLALDQAEEAGDPHLASYVRMRKSNIASDAGKPDLAIAFAQAALHGAGPMSPRLRAVALRQEAHGYALAGDYDACARALDDAFRNAADGSADDESDLAAYCTSGYIVMEAAHCWIELGRPAAAVGTLQEGLAEWSPAFRRDLGMCLARLAVAHAGDGEPDAAVAVAGHALTIAAETRSSRTTRQLGRVTDLLAPVAPDRARRLRHALRTTLSAGPPRPIDERGEPWT